MSEPAAARNVAVLSTDDAFVMAEIGRDDGVRIETLDWNAKCRESIMRERVEIGRRYGIRVGQTQTYCTRCGRPCWPGRHVCDDIRIQKLREAKKADRENGALLDKIRAFGRTKASIMLKVPLETVNSWIKRGKIPLKYRAAVSSL